jgi:hypothetical protein
MRVAPPLQRFMFYQLIQVQDKAEMGRSDDVLVEK